MGLESGTVVVERGNGDSVVAGSVINAVAVGIVKVSDEGAGETL